MSCDCTECELVDSAAKVYLLAIDNGEDDATRKAAREIWISLLCSDCYAAITAPHEHCDECGDDVDYCECEEEGCCECEALYTKSWECERVWPGIGPCLGTMDEQEDGTIECDGCFVVTNQLVVRDGELILTIHGEVGDVLLAVQTNLNDN